MRKINYIVVHCSATREGHVLTPEALESEHRRRGFRTTGYHYYIRRDGTVLGTRSLELPGAHCRGHNKYSIGHVGKDPGGYRNVDCLVDELNGRLLFNGWGHDLISYNLDGNYIGKIELLIFLRKYS